MYIYIYIYIYVGCEPATFGIPGLQENAVFMKEIEDGNNLYMINMQNRMRIVYYIYEFCRCHIIRNMKFSRIIQIAVLIRYISQEILQYELI
jgi:hypothetical protein